MSPLKNSMSVPHTPARSTSTTTSPRPATGASTSTTSALPGPLITNARIVAPSVVTIVPHAGARRRRMPGRVAQRTSGRRAGEPRLGVVGQRQFETAGLLCGQLGHGGRVEPAHVDRLVVVDPGLPGDVTAAEADAGPPDLVAVHQGGQVAGLDREEPLDLGGHAGLLLDLADRGGGRLLARVDDAGDQRPPMVVGPADQQHP